MQQILLVFHVLFALALIGLVLIQHGKGADMGAAFGSGASSTVFGARGAGSFLTRVTGILAALFFVTSLSLAFLAGRSTEGNIGSVLDRVGSEQVETPAATPAGTPAKSPAEEDVPALPPQ